MSKNQSTTKNNAENQRIIEKWMKRNNSGKVIIKPNGSEVNSQKKMQNGKRFPIIVSVTKNDETNQKPRKLSLPQSRRINTKCNNEPDVVKRKVARWSSPAVSIKIEPVVQKSENKVSQSEPESSTIVKEDSDSVQPSKDLKDKLPDNLKKICLPPKKETTNVKNHSINKKMIAKLQMNDEQDVYSSVKVNYKYLSTPKHWSVTEYENESFEQCIVFSKPHVLNENEKLITVMQRSLIIDKGGTIHYSVFGLPVNVKGTILPDALDSIKKLLSIIHIFDKMPVCKGLGDDLLIVKTDNLIQDIGQVWRHVNCKLVLVKAEHCPTCLDTRNTLLEKEMLFKSEILALQCVETVIKEEQI